MLQLLDSPQHLRFEPFRVQIASKWLLGRTEVTLQQWNDLGKLLANYDGEPVGNGKFKKLPDQPTELPWLLSHGVVLGGRGAAGALAFHEEHPVHPAGEPVGTRDLFQGVRSGRLTGVVDDDCGDAELGRERREVPGAVCYARPLSGDPRGDGALEITVGATGEATKGVIPCDEPG